MEKTEVIPSMQKLLWHISYTVEFPFEDRLCDLRNDLYVLYNTRWLDDADKQARISI